jgi:hypothetical protein
LTLLDTHIWVRWLLPDSPLPARLVQRIDADETVAVSANSCWEVAMLVQRGRLLLPVPPSTWIEEASCKGRSEYRRARAMADFGTIDENDQNRRLDKRSASAALSREYLLQAWKQQQAVTSNSPWIGSDSTKGRTRSAPATASFKSG